MPTTYNFIKSLERLDLRISYQENDGYLSAIPSRDECETQRTVLAYGTAISIRYRIADVGENKSVSSMKALESFVSESYEIFRANSSCRDIIVLDSQIIAIYSTSLKTEINEMVDDLARIRTLAWVVEKKAGLMRGTILVNLAAYYDTLAMSVIDPNSNSKHFFWRGNAISKVQNLSDNTDYGSVFISKVIWNNLTDENQKLFKLSNNLYEVYFGNIVNRAMKNWLDTK